ncbi:MAG: arsenic transporter [Aquifex sp.]|nr:MAG: arsenic transporter [Aquifex sp.]
MEHNAVGLLNLFNLHLSKDSLQNVALGIFIGTYVMIMLEKYFHRTIAALLGASAVMILGILPPHEAWKSIDYNTFFLLFGMMNIVTVMAHSGFFHILAVKTLRFTGTNPFKILLTFTILTAFFSAFLDNVTTILFMVPIIIRITKLLSLNPVPYIIALVLASNTGGTTTLIGDPPNIIIGSIAKKSFMDFIIHVAPHALVGFFLGLVLNFAYLKLTGAFKSSEGKVDLSEFEEIEKEETYPDLIFKSVTVFIATIVFFALGHYVHLEPGVIALLMSSLLMLWSGLSPEYVLEKVEWATLVFFIGLFIVVGALEHTGVFEKVAGLLVEHIGDDINKGLWLIGIFSSVISGFVDNIPFTMSMAYVLKDMSMHMSGVDFDKLWWALSLGACLGGNFTLIGASANIVAAAIAEREKIRISFFTFMKYGTPVALFSTLASLFSLYLFG